MLIVAGIGGINTTGVGIVVEEGVAEVAVIVEVVVVNVEGGAGNIEGPTDVVEEVGVIVSGVG